MIATALADSLEQLRSVKRTAAAGAGTEPCRVVVVSDTCVSEEGMAANVGRNKRYHVCGGAHGFYDAGELIRKHCPDILDRDMCNR
jgi:hypothetical protein